MGWGTGNLRFIHSNSLRFMQRPCSVHSDRRGETCHTLSFHLQKGQTNRRMAPRGQVGLRDCELGLPGSGQGVPRDSGREKMVSSADTDLMHNAPPEPALSARCTLPRGHHHCRLQTWVPVPMKLSLPARLRSSWQLPLCSLTLQTSRGQGPPISGIPPLGPSVTGFFLLTSSGCLPAVAGARVPRK